LWRAANPEAGKIKKIPMILYDMQTEPFLCQFAKSFVESGFIKSLLLIDYIEEQQQVLGDCRYSHLSALIYCGGLQTQKLGKSHAN
jgi:hypothetical protein